MDAIEKAIRNAFEKGNAGDRAFREKVYRSAFAALDRALQANPGVTVETAIRRRKAMQAKIAEIESEFLPAVAVPSVDADEESGAAAPAVDSPGVAQQTAEDAAAIPDIRLERTPAGTPAPETAPAGAVSAEVAPDRDERRARRRFPLGAVLAGLLLAAVGGGLWWALENGILRLPDRSAELPPPAMGETSSADPGAAGQARAWVTVFTPADPTLVSAPAGAKAEVMKDDTGTFLRIRSGTPGSAVGFDVGQGILEQLAGKDAVFDIVARAEDGNDTQMSVDCDFGEFGDCGRRRYAVGHQKNEYLFEVRFPDERPGAAGTIAINPDFDGQGKSVDIYEIRASVAE